MNNSKYIDYVNSHVDEIAAYVDECFERSKDFIKIKLIRLINEEFGDIHDSCEDFDRIYDNCIANEFFFGTPAVEFVGIENMLLKDIVEKK